MWVPRNFGREGTGGEMDKKTIQPPRHGWHGERPEVGSLLQVMWKLTHDCGYVNGVELGNFEIIKNSDTSRTKLIIEIIEESVYPFDIGLSDIEGYTLYFDDGTSTQVTQNLYTFQPVLDIMYSHNIDIIDISLRSYRIISTL